MRNWGLLTLLIVPALTSNASAAPAKKKAKGAAQWNQTLAQGLAQAKKTGKPLFVDFYTTWCGPCKYLDQVTYRDSKFIKESKYFILVKIDAEKNKTNVRLAHKFRVAEFPTMIIMRPNGSESERIVGGYPAKELVPKMRKGGLTALGGRSI
jgi:thiol:disulfide interchange protein